MLISICAIVIGDGAEPFELKAMTPLSKFFDTHRSEAAVATSLQGLDVPAELQLLTDFDCGGDDEIVTGITAMGASIRNIQAIEAEPQLFQGKIFT